MGLVKQCMPPERVEMGGHLIEQKDRLGKGLGGREPRPLPQDYVEQKRLLLTG